MTKFQRLRRKAKFADSLGFNLSALIWYERITIKLILGIETIIFPSLLVFGISSLFGSFMLSANLVLAHDYLTRQDSELCEERFVKIFYSLVFTILFFISRCV